MIDKIQANAQMTVEQLRQLSRIDFGYNAASIEWLEGYIERLRTSGEYEDEATKEKLISVFGSFVGECIVRCYGGEWTTDKDGNWSVRFGDNFAFPFTKVTKQIENGLEDGIGGFFRAIPLLCKDSIIIQPPPPPPRKPWWRFW
ncbi:MAG TPA: hypothetical protein VM680_14185 [Verrucomicrobiae bacterium]|nr:hypothetical protein [Verrucomicrobiae bacterium]